METGRRKEKHGERTRSGHISKTEGELTGEVPHKKKCQAKTANGRTFA